MKFLAPAVKLCIRTPLIQLCYFSLFPYVGGNPCQGIAKCINTPGSFECSCPAGYKLDRTGRKCNDINECQELISACQHGTCVNMEGSFQCTCNEGFSLTDSRETCVDTNECLSPGICGNGTCINIFGSFRFVHGRSEKLKKFRPKNLLKLNKSISGKKFLNMYFP